MVGAEFGALKKKEIIK